MLQIALASFLVWLFFKIKEKDGLIDGFAAMSFVVVPAIVVFLVSLAIHFLSLPAALSSIAELLYIAFPFFMLKQMTDYSTKKRSIYSVIVFVLVMVSHIPFVILFGPEM